MALPLNLTIGVELEFILLARLDRGEELFSEKGELAVYEALQNCTVANGKSPYGLFSSKLRIHNRNLQPGNLNDFSKWSIVSDDSCSLLDQEMQMLPGTDYKGFPIELRSRVFEYYQDDWRTEIASVIRTLHEHFNQPDSRYRILVNERCGLHVHVGNRKEGFPLQTVQNLIQLVTAYEHCFDSLHTTQRISGKYYVDGKVLDCSGYCRAPSEQFLAHARWALLRDEALDKLRSSKIENGDEWLRAPNNEGSCVSDAEGERDIYGNSYTTETTDSDDFPHEPLCMDEPIPLDRKEDLCSLKYSKSPTAWLRLIASTETIDGVCHLLGMSPHDQAYNLENLLSMGDSQRSWSSPSSSVRSVQMRPTFTLFRDKYDLEFGEAKKTIEFRQHHGSLDVLEILAWIEVVALLTEWSHCVGAALVSQTIRLTRLMDAELDVLDLLEQLGGRWWHGRCRSLPAWVIAYYPNRRAAATTEDEFHWAMSRIAPTSPFYRVMQHVEQARRTQRTYKNIQGKIRNKIEEGKYGDLLAIVPDDTELTDTSSGGVPLPDFSSHLRMIDLESQKYRVEEWVGQRQLQQMRKEDGDGSSDGYPLSSDGSGGVKILDEP